MVDGQSKFDAVFVETRRLRLRRDHSRVIDQDIQTSLFGQKLVGESLDLWFKLLVNCLT